jgi:soluble lytic murein transglycosylase
MNHLRRMSMIALAAGTLLGVGAFWHAESVGNIDRVTTSSIPELDTTAEQSTETLKSALAALDAADFDTLRGLRAELPNSSLDARILDWAMAVSGRSGIRASEIAAAMGRLTDWPDLARMRDNYERALVRERANPVELIDIFTSRQPETLTGAIALARAHKRLGQDDKARDVLAPRWRAEVIDARSELLILSEFADILTPEDHAHRFLAMMYRDRIRSAERVAKPGGMESFAKPWAAAIRKKANAGKLLDAADEEFKKTPHHLFARVTWLRRLEKDKDAAKLLLQSPTDESNLVDADEWWVERRIVSRDALERGDPETAYRIAAMHRGGSANTQIEAAFHAGWYALRGLKDAEKAIAHFRQIELLSNGSISKSRGVYWLGRAYEALGNQEAKANYRRAAQYETTYYGQLARQELGMDLSDLRRPSVTREDMNRFRSHDAIAAMHRLEAIGATDLSRKLAVGLGQSLDSTSQITQLVAHLEQRDERQIALRIAKAANWRGIETGALTHPVGAIPASTPISPSERPLAYAVARQESEFNVAARSQANALGLMQLLPGTAREVAQQTGLAYSRSRLDSDGAYNAALGTAYLNTQLDRFDNSYILTFIAYNAGPGRARDWLKRFGDPRGKPLDEVIDWVEMIPFTETRNYVQRVMENYQVYKARLGEPADIESDLRFGRKG